MRIGLVDSEHFFMLGIAFLLERKRYVITFKAQNGKEMCDSLHTMEKNELPEIIILDLKMPEMDGFEAIVWLKSHFPQIKVIVLTSQSSRPAIVQALKLGANSYLTKNTTPAELMEAIESVQKYGEYYTRVISKTLVENLQDGKEVLDINSKIDQLTSREKEIIKLISEEYTSSDISIKLMITPRTVEAHISNIISKLSVKSRVGVALLASKHGLLN